MSAWHRDTAEDASTTKACAAVFTQQTEVVRASADRSPTRTRCPRQPTAFAPRPRHPPRGAGVFEPSAPTAELSHDPAIRFLLRFFVYVPALPTAGHAQCGVRPPPTPTRTPADGVERLFTRRAQLHVFTADERESLDPPLDITDAPPPAMSVRRIRADSPRAAVRRGARKLRDSNF